MKPRHIAVIGSGVSGLAAAWLLSKRHRVTLVEASGRIGGHSNTVDCMIEGRRIPVDTGFIVYNAPAYPNLTALFSHLKVPTSASDMSFSVSLGSGAYEYGGRNLFQLFGYPGNLANPGHWLLIRDILRFFRTAAHTMAGLPEATTIGGFLEDQGYSSYFIERHLLPMAAAIWSSAPGDMLDYPARAFIRFFANHGLLQISNRPQWRTVAGGSREYVSRLMQDGQFDVRTGSAVRSVHRSPVGVKVVGAQGGQIDCDEVVVATHADQALAMLADASPAERRILSAFRYSQNRAILHRDGELMPKRRYLWSSWNYMGELQPMASSSSAVTYWMNALQPLGVETPVFVSLNPPRPPRDSEVMAAFDYAHPVFDPAAMRAQREIWSLQGVHRTWFCGAHFGSGFHEDGLQSGLAVAEQLGQVRRPWSVEDESGRIHVHPVSGRRVPHLVAAE